jgi:hypothetical protein
MVTVSCALVACRLHVGGVLAEPQISSARRYSH